MALSEKSRSSLYLGLTSLVPDEQAVEEMLSYFPARDVEEPATKEFVRAESAITRTELAITREELKTEMASLRTDLHHDMDELRTELKTDMADLRTELRIEMAELRTEMHRMVRTMQTWMVGTAISLGSLVVAVNAAFG